MKNVADAIKELAEKVNHDDVSFFDVMQSTVQRLQKATGKPAFEPDPAVEKALEELASALTNAFSRQKMDILKKTVSGLGYGVAAGRFGTEFFEQFKSH